MIPVHAYSFLETLFSVTANLTYPPGANQSAINTVNTAVITALQTEFSFANRNFGQGVSADEVAAIIQGVSGVVAVNVTGVNPGLTSSAGDITGSNWSLSAYQTWQSQPITLTRPSSGAPNWICPYVPIANPTLMPNPAEILVLNPDPSAVTLGVMQ